MWRGRIKNPLIQLLDAPHLQPADNLDNVESRTYADMITASGLMEIAKYASGVGGVERPDRAEHHPGW